MRQLILSLVLVTALVTVPVVTVYADCKDEIQEVRDDIENNKDKYTREAIAEARKHLLDAELPSLKLADCRREVMAAKKALRQGKK